MTDPSDHSLSRTVGANIRRIRDVSGLKVDDLVRSARGLGLTWGGTTIRAMEAGERALTAEQLLLLPYVLHRAGAGGAVGPIGLLHLLAPLHEPDLPMNVVEIGPLPHEQAHLAGLLQGQPYFDVVAPGEQARPMDLQYHARMPDARFARRRRDRDVRRYMQGRPERRRLDYSEAEQRLAEILRLPLDVLDAAAQDLYGRSVLAEREARVRDRAAQDADDARLRGLRAVAVREIRRELIDHLRNHRVRVPEGLRGVTEKEN